MNVSVPQSVVQASSLEIPLSGAAGSRTRANESARGDKPPAANSTPTGKAELSYVAQGSPLWNDLDSLQHQMKSEIHIRDLVVGLALTVTTGLTVGYVIWMIRGGMLVSSLLAQMPAWRLVDPLVVLSQVDDDSWAEDDNRGQESLQSIVDTLDGTPETAPEVQR